MMFFRVLSLSLLSFFTLDTLVGQEGGGGKFTDEVSWEADIQPIVKDFCTTCHAGDDPEADLGLTSYALVREATEHGDLLERINDADDPMPEDGLMPSHLRRLVRIWSETGYTEKSSLTKEQRANSKEKYEDFTPPEIVPVDITEVEEGFELLKRMQGHWVGSMRLMGEVYDWMAFDYRPISESHIHGIYEGGTIGNLFTSFFVADFKGKRTIMARNGGVLNGIYRTSYFVLDKVDAGRWQTKYRLVDAYGGKDIMYMELTFSGKSLVFAAYTSRMGLKSPQLHMRFRGKPKRPELASAAAAAVGFPKNVPAFTLPDPMPVPTWAADYPLTSASYIWESQNLPLLELAKKAKDPITISDMPYLSQLQVDIERSEATKGKKLHVYLSEKPLADENGKFIGKGGYIKMDLLDGLFSFPELSSVAEEFTFTYLHPGKYYLTVFADMDEDWYPSPGDICNPSLAVELKPGEKRSVKVDQLTGQN